MGWKVLKGLLPFPRTSMLCRIWTEVISSGWIIKSTDCSGFGFRLREGLSWEHGRLQLQRWSLPRAKWGIGLLENLLLIREIRWGKGRIIVGSPLVHLFDWFRSGSFVYAFRCLAIDQGGCFRLFWSGFIQRFSFRFRFMLTYDETLS